MMPRLLIKVFGFIVIVIGLQCIIFTLIVIFNLLPHFDKLPEFAKSYIQFPFNISKYSPAMNWEGIKHLSVLQRIIHSAVAIFWGCGLAIGGLFLLVLGRRD